MSRFQRAKARFASMLLVIAPLALSISPAPARADGHGFAADNTWVAFLKCQDLIGKTTASINHQSFPIYSMWLRGYIAGVSSLSTVSITEKIQFSDVAASLLIYCSRHQSDNAVEAAVHVGSLFYNVLNANNASERLPAEHDRDLQLGYVTG